MVKGFDQKGQIVTANLKFMANQLALIGCNIQQLVQLGHGKNCAYKMRIAQMQGEVSTTSRVAAHCLPY